MLMLFHGALVSDQISVDHIVLHLYICQFCWLRLSSKGACHVG